MKDRTLAFISILAGAVLFVAAGQVRASSTRVENVPTLECKFRADSAWNGADGALSVPLGKNKNLWLFGDTFIRTKGVATKERKMVRNTAAIQDLSRSEAPFKFFWKENRARDACDLIAPPSNGKSVSSDWYWPGAGIKYGGKLFLIMKRVRATGSGPEEFRFDWYRDDLVIVENPDDQPTDWRLSYHTLPESNGKILFGVASLSDGENFYVYCSVPAQKTEMHPHPTAVARIPLNSLALSRYNDWQFYCRSNGKDSDGVWTKDAGKIKTLFPDGASEMSVDKEGQSFVALYQPPLSATIMIRRALSPQGPFSSAYPVYRCPESDLKAAGANVLVYSAKTHPELSDREGERIVTYCVNPGPLEAHTARPDLYFPRCLKIVEDDY